MFSPKHVRAGQPKTPVRAVVHSENFHNKGPTQNPPSRGRLRTPTALRLTNNVNQNTKESCKAAPIFCQSTPPVVFHPEVPEFSPNILTDIDECPALPASAKNAYATQSITKTTTPDTATPEAVRSIKRN